MATGGDYKYDMQMIAEELAWERYDQSFYVLTEIQRNDLFREAELQWAESRYAKAEFYRDCRRDDAAKRA